MRSTEKGDGAGRAGVQATRGAGSPKPRRSPGRWRRRVLLAGVLSTMGAAAAFLVAGVLDDDRVEDRGYGSSSPPPAGEPSRVGADAGPAAGDGARGRLARAPRPSRAAVATVLAAAGTEGPAAPATPAPAGSGPDAGPSAALAGEPSGGGEQRVATPDGGAAPASAGPTTPARSRTRPAAHAAAVDAGAAPAASQELASRAASGSADGELPPDAGPPRAANAPGAPMTASAAHATNAMKATNARTELASAPAASLTSDAGDFGDGQQADAEGPGLRRVSRFAVSGGATLEGRVVAADTGKPLAGTVVRAHHAGAFVEVNTDATGAFRVPGLLPRTRVVLWLGGRKDPFIDERLELAMPGDGQLSDAGVIRLLRGDELASRLRGWVGLFVSRRGGRIVVSGVTPWSPADRAGLAAGDQLVSIDGRDVAGLGPRAVTFLMRGPPGTPVTLVARAADGATRKHALSRVPR